MPAHHLTSRDGKPIPLREPHPLDVYAALAALRAAPQDGPYIAIALVGELGAARPRTGGMDARDYARAVADYLAASIDLQDLIRQADAVLVALLQEHRLIPTVEEVAQAGESSRAMSRSTRGSSSPAPGPETPAAGGP